MRKQTSNGHFGFGLTSGKKVRKPDFKAILMDLSSRLDKAERCIRINESRGMYDAAMKHRRRREKILHKLACLGAKYE